MSTYIFTDNVGQVGTPTNVTNLEANLMYLKQESSKQDTLIENLQTENASLQIQINTHNHSIMYYTKEEINNLVIATEATWG